MEITFQAPIGQRILRRYIMGITTFDGLWWCYETKRWVEEPKCNASTHAPCKSYKAFLRHIRKHPELKGYEVILVSRFRDNDIIVRV